MKIITTKERIEQINYSNIHITKVSSFNWLSYKIVTCSLFHKPNILLGIAEVVQIQNQL